MTLLDSIIKLYPEFDEIVSSPILNVNKEIQGWESVAYLKNRYPIGGGTHLNKDVAVRICIAEVFERGFFKLILNNSKNDDFLISEFPTSCGFACGFECDKTKERAISEGLERWIWSKWIDEGYLIEENLFPNLDSLAKEYLNRFEKSKFFQKEFSINGNIFKIGIFLGFVNNGVFAGSRVCMKSDEPWQHALTEAFRNYQNYTLHDEIKSNKSEFVRLRAIYFGNHASEAIRHISNCNKGEWPEPRIRLLKEYQTEFYGVYLWRCLFYDWIGWHKGDEKRFVY